MGEEHSDTSIHSHVRPLVRRRWLWLFVPLLAGLWVARWYFFQRPVDEQVAEARQAIKIGDRSAAESALRKAVELDPGRIEPYYLLGDLYLQDDPERAVKLYNQMIAVNPGAPHELCRLAEAYLAAGESGGGRAYARRAVLAEPNCARAHEQLGIALDRADQHPQALAELERAHALEPNNLHITIELAQAQLSGADLAQAAETARQVLRSDPENARAWYVVGWADSRMPPTPENQKAAAEALTKALTLDPWALDAASELGRLEASQRHFEAARQYLERAWNAGERNVGIAYSLASVYRALGDRQNAATLLERFQALQRIESRRKDLQMQFALTPHDLDLAVRLALVEAEAGHQGEAEMLLRAVLDQRPDDAAALAAERKIGNK